MLPAEKTHTPALGNISLRHYLFILDYSTQTIYIYKNISCHELACAQSQTPEGSRLDMNGICEIESRLKIVYFFLIHPFLSFII